MNQPTPEAWPTRRQMVRALGGGLGTLGIWSAFERHADANERPAHWPGRAKRVIHLFMNGGPFAADLFDPKPQLEKFAGQRPAEVDLRTERKTAGLMPSPFRFRPAGRSGVPVSELLPPTANCIDDICVIRSTYTDNPNHGPALLLMNNGTILPTRPSMGSWISYGLGSENADLPDYVVLCPVRFVQVYYGDGQPWDTHNNHNENVRNLCRDIDRPIAALLQDLQQRGLLDETLVFWSGEFGRTPTSENGNGRDHNHYGFTTWLAGAGIKGGMTYGETDAFGFRAVQDRVHIHDLHATILHQLGIDHERLTFRYAGRDFRLTDVAGRVLREVEA